MDATIVAIVIIVALVIIAGIVVLAVKNRDIRRRQAESFRERAADADRTAEQHGAEADALAARARKEHAEAEARQAEADRIRSEEHKTRSEAEQQQRRANALDPDRKETSERPTEPATGRDPNADVPGQRDPNTADVEEPTTRRRWPR